ncbi:hypothetical protein BDW42DRAFT_107950 [Aspergillus taichungensis]|uniref:Uncharacterized protein n=1 Tax=Aspergillus taichungensis TaxID=482145 RepID=A0A2J5I7V2_9EURO|nr:hypothetical protein BDW42DRAFT_107950 [Aspergillus taichungensis]
MEEYQSPCPRHPLIKSKTSFGEGHQRSTSSVIIPLNAHIITLIMDDSIQQIRNHIMRQIQRVLFEFLRDIGPDTMRVLGDIPNSILDPKDYLGSIRPFASKDQDCPHESHASHETRFIAVNIYRGKHFYFVVDLNNTDYNYQTAHECKTLIPVHILCLSKREPTICRKPELVGPIAESLRIMHNGHGQDPLPLFDNYCDENSQYGNPRSLQHDAR